MSKLSGIEWLSQFKGHVVLHCLTHGLPKEEQEKIIAEFGVTKEMDVRVIINGRETNFDVWLNHVQKHLEDDVARTAERLVRERYTVVHELTDRLEKVIRAECVQALGFDPWERDL